MIVKKILKKIIIKLCRICGYEIIDQNEFEFPSLKNRKYNDLSLINEKSIIIPLGEVKISRKIESLSIIRRLLVIKVKLLVLRANFTSLIKSDFNFYPFSSKH